jgi:nucleoid-associated protein YgaU
MTQQTRKNIFQSAINALSSKDEKAALETAAKEMDELEAKLAQTSSQLTEAQKQVLKLQDDARKAQADAAKAQSDLTKTQADLAQSQKDLQAARGETSALQANLNVSNQQLAAAKAQINQYLTKEQADAATAAIAAAEKAKILTEHTLTPDESLSHMALKYYGNAGEAYWRVIYEANKELIGPNPSRVRPGMVIKIPVLPEELKKK